jgi:hypothetical protein
MSSSLSTELREFVDGMDGQDVEMGRLVDTIGDRGFGLLLLILALPAALPLPAPGYATPFGFIILILGSQMLRGRPTPWLPDRVRARKVNWKLLDFSVRNGRIPFAIVEFFVRPRLSGLARNRAFLAMVSLTIMLMATSMCVPMPLTNTAPSFVIFVLAAGMLEEDGLLLAAGMLLAPVAAAIAGYALYVGITLGPEAVETTVKPAIKGLLGLS